MVNRWANKKTADFTNNTIIWNIPYRPGTLEAKGYNDGKEVALSSACHIKKIRIL